MSDFKITGGPGSPSSDPIGDAHSTLENVSKTSDIGETSSVELGAVERIAADVASEAINREEAVHLLLADVLDSAMVRAAPGTLREELKDVLETLLSTDANLGSLTAAIGPREIK